MIWVALPLHLLMLYAVGFVATWVMSFGTLHAIDRIHGSRTDLFEDAITATFAAISWPLVLVCVVFIVVISPDRENP